MIIAIARLATVANNQIFLMVGARLDVFFQLNTTTEYQIYGLILSIMLPVSLYISHLRFLDFSRD